MNAHGPTGATGPRLSYVTWLDPDVVLADDVVGVVVLAADVLADVVVTEAVVVADVPVVDALNDVVLDVDGRVVAGAIVVGGFDGELTTGVADEPPDEAEPLAPESVALVALHPPTRRAAVRIHGAREPARDMSDDTQPDHRRLPRTGQPEQLNELPLRTQPLPVAITTQMITETAMKMRPMIRPAVASPLPLAPGLFLI